MTSSPQRRPLDVPQDLRHAAAMVLARYPNSPAANGLRSSERKRLALKAGAIALLCACLAFVFFVTGERDSSPGASLAAAQTQRLRYGTVAASEAPQELADAKAIRATPMAISLPQDRSRRITEFILAKSPEFQNLGAVSLRLNSVDTQRNSYSLSLQTHGSGADTQVIDRQDVGLNEPIKIDREDGTPELVVGAILQNRVWGYLSEPKFSAQPRRTSPPENTVPLTNVSNYTSSPTHSRHARRAAHRSLHRKPLHRARTRRRHRRHRHR